MGKRGLSVKLCSLTPSHCADIVVSESTATSEAIKEEKMAIALDEAVESGRVQRGDLILLVVFGAGLTWGAAVIEW